MANNFAFYAFLGLMITVKISRNTKKFINNSESKTVIFCATDA
jgi:hypothetical protein